MGGTKKMSDQLCWTSDRLIFSVSEKLEFKFKGSGIEFLSQTLILLFLYLCISMSETLDISN